MDPLAKLGFARRDIRLMTDKADVTDEADVADESDKADGSRDLPTKDNIVRRPCELSLLPLHFVQLAAMRALVHDAQPGDSFFFYCTLIRLGQSNVY